MGKWLMVLLIGLVGCSYAMENPRLYSEYAGGYFITNRQPYDHTPQEERLYYGTILKLWRQVNSCVGDTALDVSLDDIRFFVADDIMRGDGAETYAVSDRENAVIILRRDLAHWEPLMAHELLHQITEDMHHVGDFARCDPMLNVEDR